MNGDEMESRDDLRSILSCRAFALSFRLLMVALRAYFPFQMRLFESVFQELREPVDCRVNPVTSPAQKHVQLMQ